MDLALDSLPDLPQNARIKSVALKLWSRPEVLAIWVGGSMATGRADAYSDVDLFLALPAHNLPDWVRPDLDLLFDGLTQLHHLSSFGAEFFVHHLMLATGEVYDLHIQSVDHPPTSGRKLILGCREPAFLARLRESHEQPKLEFEAATPQSVERIVAAYWLNAHKHRKVLARNLDLVAWTGLKLLQPNILRLHYILVTGNDCGDLGRATIHHLTPVAQAIQQTLGPDALVTVGLPLRTHPEIIAAIDALNDDVARIGRQLADRLDFVYPSEAEDVVLKAWSEFKAQQLA